MTPEQFLAKCEAAFAADEPQVIPAAVARAMCEAMRVAIPTVAAYGSSSSFWLSVRAFESACKEIES